MDRDVNVLPNATLEGDGYRFKEKIVILLSVEMFQSFFGRSGAFHALHD